MTRLFFITLTLLAVVCACTTASGKQTKQEPIIVPLSEISAYTASDFSSEVTECDRIGAHPDDPGKIQAGLFKPAMNLPKVIEVCEAAVAKDPDNPRLNYQLGRAYGYSGKHAEGQVYRNRAVRAGYPQSLFVIGFIRISGWDGRPADPCYGGHLIRMSAKAKHIAGLISFPHHVLNDTFKACTDLETPDVAELTQYLEQAKQAKPDYYQGLLIERLQKDLTEL